MTKNKAKNEIIKRKFFGYLKGAEGCCESTITSIEKAIVQYQEFTKEADFSSFSQKKVEDFKEWLHNRQFRGKKLSLVTIHTYLRYLRKFFVWLAWQPGYKSKIRQDAINYLKVTKKEAKIASQSSPRNYPSLNYVIKLANSISPITEIDQRDQALIAFTLLSGMRDKAITTLPLGCFDEEKQAILQDPRLGVDTKFSKLIPSTLLQFNPQLLNCFLNWVTYLKSKGYGIKDPLFPRSKQTQGENNLSFESSTEIEPEFWRVTGSIRSIFKQRAENAGLPYFPPHTFRHLAIDLALKNACNGEEIKAISQNFGHEHISTTLSSYANYDPARLSEILKNMDFSGKQKESIEDKIYRTLKKFEKEKEQNKD